MIKALFFSFISIALPLPLMPKVAAPDPSLLIRNAIPLYQLDSVIEEPIGESRLEQTLNELHALRYTMRSA